MDKLIVPLRLLISALLVLFQGSVLAVNQGDVTAVMLYNLASFITLPKLVEQQDNYHICIVENPQFAKRLKALTGSKNIRKKPIKVVDIDRQDENLLQCQLLYIPSSRDYLEGTLLKKVRGEAVVTVGDSDSFIDKGGVITLFLQKNRLRFHLDIDHANEQQLKVRAQLRSLSRELP